MALQQGVARTRGACVLEDTNTGSERNVVGLLVEQHPAACQQPHPSMRDGALLLPPTQAPATTHLPVAARRRTICRGGSCCRRLLPLLLCRCGLRGRRRAGRLLAIRLLIRCSSLAALLRLALGLWVSAERAKLRSARGHVLINLAMHGPLQGRGGHERTWVGAGGGGATKRGLAKVAGGKMAVRSAVWCTQSYQRSRFAKCRC